MKKQKQKQKQQKHLKNGVPPRVAKQKNKTHIKMAHRPEQKHKQTQTVENVAVFKTKQKHVFEKAKKTQNLANVRGHICFAFCIFNVVFVCDLFC